MAKLQARFDVYLMHVYIARTNHLSCVTALFQCLLRQIVDVALQEWLLSCPDVCLGTLTLLHPIVTKNMCFYGCRADLQHVLLLAVATQLRMNCFDDLFVSTDMASMSISGVQDICVHCTVQVRSSIQ